MVPMPIRVLFVEDQPNILKAQVKLLKHFEEIEIVGEALSGEQALEMVAQVKPDVLLLDLGLPQMSGMEVTRRVRSEHPEIEILIFTIFDEEEKVTEAIASGAAGYLLKGTPATKIVDAIKDVAEGGAVIQPNLARALLKLVTAPRKPTATIPEYNPNAVTSLTTRELEILQIISKGLSNNEAASVLNLSKATIRTHLEHIYEKLDVSNRVEAVTEGLREGLISL
jgi:DNA-binding NarL/FixJ family response regulator